MRNLSINSKEDLKAAKQLFEKNYKTFFKQDLKSSKAEAFIALMAGVKDYNTLINSFKTSDIHSLGELESELYDEDSKVQIGSLMKAHTPPNLDLERTEHFDGELFYITRITHISDIEVPDHEDIQKMKSIFLKRFPRNHSYKLSNLNKQAALELFQEENSTYTSNKKIISLLFKFYSNIIKSEKDAFIFALDFLIFSNEGLISDERIALIKENVDNVLIQDVI